MTTQEQLQAHLQADINTYAVGSSLGTLQLTPAHHLIHVATKCKRLGLVKSLATCDLLLEGVLQTAWNSFVRNLPCNPPDYSEGREGAPVEQKPAVVNYKFASSGHTSRKYPVHQKGVVPRRTSVEDVNDILDMCALGRSTKEISATLGISTTVVTRIRRGVESPIGEDARKAILAWYEAHPGADITPPRYRS